MMKPIVIVSCFFFYHHHRSIFFPQRGQQGLPLHHQQDPAGRADPLPDRRPDVRRPPHPAQLLQGPLPRHHAAHQAGAQEGREGARQVRLRGKRECIADISQNQDILIKGTTNSHQSTVP